MICINRWSFFIAVCIVGTTLFGCGANEKLQKTVSGKVVYDGTEVPTGTVRFVSSDKTNSTHITQIVDGQYLFDDAKSIPFGKWRVEVDARKKTGRKVRKFIGTEAAMVDEKIRLGPDIFADGRSPLSVEIGEDFNGCFDISIPNK